MRVFLAVTVALASAAVLASLADGRVARATTQDVTAATLPTVVRITVKAGRPVGGIKRPSVRKGTVVRLVVVVDRGESMHLHGYNFERQLKPGQKAVIHFTAKIPGRFELEMHNPDAVLAQLTVRP